MTKYFLRTIKAKTQISLLSVGSYKDQMFLHAESENSDPTVRMPRLICVFARCTCHFVDFVVLRLNLFLWYPLLRFSCETDSNTHFIQQSTHETRFVFRDFENRIGEEGFDVRCHVTFCAASDVTPRCLQRCNANNILIG